MSRQTNTGEKHVSRFFNGEGQSGTAYYRVTIGSRPHFPGEQTRSFTKTFPGTEGGFVDAIAWRDAVLSGRPCIAQTPAPVDPLLDAVREERVHIPGEPGKPLTWEQLEKPHFIYGFRVNGSDGVDEVKRGYSHDPESVLAPAQRFTSRKLVLAFTIKVYTPGVNNRKVAYDLEQQMKRDDAQYMILGGGDEVFTTDILPDWKQADLVDGHVVPRTEAIAA